MKYYAQRLDGTVTEYTSRDALRRAKARSGGQHTIVASWPENDPPPGNNASGWDDWRLRRGLSGSYR